MKLSLVWIIVVGIIVVLVRRNVIQPERVIHHIIDYMGDTPIDYGVYERVGYSDPVVVWGTIPVILQLLRTTPHDINVKFSDPVLLRRVHPQMTSIRLQTPTYHQGLHFDCYNQRVLQVSGVKRWILFEHSVYDDRTIDLIRRCNSHTSLDPVIRILSDLNIPVVEFYMTPGQSRYIAAGVWHQTEGMEGDIQITMNRTLTTTDVHRRGVLLKHFATLFPVQATACTINNCRY